MRQGRSSSKHETKGMEIDKISKLKEEPHLSGAYIRSLVKQLTSSKTKDSMNINPKDNPDCVVLVDGHHQSFPGQNLTKLGEAGLSETQQQTQQTQQTQRPQQHKKQVRRRLHTSRPYQERLLNMAEARREIVTALKFHRAAMKQANEQQQQQQEQQQPPSPQQPQSQLLQPPLHFEQQEGKVKHRRNHRIYPSNTSIFSNYLDNLSSYSSNFSSHHNHQLPPPNPLFWPSNSPISTLPFGGDQNLNFTLPNQALGLNLNFHDFNNIDTTSLYHHNPSFHSNSASASASSPSSSSSPTISAVTDYDPYVSPAMAGPAAVSPADFIDSSATTSSGGGLHAAMDDEEMAEIRSIGEQHQMEWNDTMNLVTSAYWLKFLKAEGDHHDDDGDGINGFKYPFDDQFMEFPAWLSANEQQHFDDYYCSDDYFQSPALPW
ncbi:hypothetical protein L484_018634 [Morus notabilis]|uniref:Uncharacterized protein n=1 Tax=Morus notabilis TaxID=981085 RepID=W9RVU2_9ROSA|nr:hypothetical protein L484_018634 [Morus notabilis]